jgi:hypothetical protein
VFDVVHDQQQVSARHRRRDAIGWRSAAHFIEPESARDLLQDEFRIPHGGEVGEHDAVPEPGRRRGRKSQASLTDPGWSGERDQPGVRAGQRVVEEDKLGIPSEQRRGRDRERSAPPGPARRAAHAATPESQSRHRIASDPAAKPPTG